jgi:hypothetical protein
MPGEKNKRLFSEPPIISEKTVHDLQRAMVE